jgi:hypothetical protein
VHDPISNPKAHMIAGFLISSFSLLKTLRQTIWLLT